MMHDGFLARASPRRRPPTAHPPSRRPVILAVDDEHYDWLMYSQLLCHYGFEVLHARDGEEGLHLAREHLPDLVLADLMLPRMTGIELCRTLKQERRTRRIPVLMLTARAERECGDAAREAGCDGYLEKPIGPVRVLRAVERLIGRPPPPATHGR
jgi:two-component system, cell cycle response regulator DivK